MYYNNMYTAIQMLLIKHINTEKTKVFLMKKYAYISYLPHGKDKLGISGKHPNIRILPNSWLFVNTAILLHVQNGVYRLLSVRP